MSPTPPLPGFPTLEADAARARANAERLRRWRLVLGGEADDPLGSPLVGQDVAMDQALAALYGDAANGAGPSGAGGFGRSAPTVARWLGDIRRYFPGPVVQLLQQQVLAKLDLRTMLSQPELLRAVQPDVPLVANLLALRSILPPESLDTARAVVAQVVADLQQRLAEPTRQAIVGSLSRAGRNRRPRIHEIDWPRTIRANLQHYQPDYQTVIPVTRIGFDRQRRTLRDVILCVDQSGSMATSVVYAGIFGAVLASLPSLQTSVVVYDTAVVDLTAALSDPVELLFGTQLGGGTDTCRALDYCAGLIRRPEDTIFLLISDLYDGVDNARLVRLLSDFAARGVRTIALLALSDDGKPAYHHGNAQALADRGVPVFACTPDLFPDMMAAAIGGRDLNEWAASCGIVTTRPQPA